MREGESQVDHDRSVETSLDDSVTEFGVETERERSADEQAEDSGDAGVVRSQLGKVATTRSLGTALGLSVVGIVALGFVPVLSVANTILGIAAAGFAYGLGSEQRRYVEMALAGAVTGGATTLLGNLAVAVLASGATLLGLALLAGGVAGVLGHYFGQDLRAGLTADLD